MMRLWTSLSEAQLQGLRRHKYSAQGSSLTEPVMQIYWNWLVTKVPLWMAPNLITALGLVINIATILPVLLLDTNLEGVAPSWTYIAGAVGLFVYQSLDAIDGKQARRTGSANQLGELFDHSCDTLSLFLVLASGVSAVGLRGYPIAIVMFMVLLGQVNYVYHWQSYVCGTLHFNLVDVTEGQFLLIALLLIRGVSGMELWDLELPGTGLEMRLVLVVVSLTLTLLNMFQAFSIILTRGVGKNGTTVANTSVLSPLVTMMVLIPVPFLYSSVSPSPLHHNCLLFLSAMCLPNVKAVITMILASMTRTPYPLLDPLYLGPWTALLNVLIGCPLPDTFMLAAVLVWEVIDLVMMCTTVCRQIADFLNIHIFIIPTA